MASNNFGKSDVILKPDGNKITRETLIADAVNYYSYLYQNGITDVCDFSEGSEIRTLHESFIVELFSLYKEMFRTAKMKFLLDSEGTYLDRIGCEYHLNRHHATPASGSVTFSTNETLNGNYKIPKGTAILSRTTGEEYILQEDVTLRSSATPTNGTVRSVNAGAKYNAEPNTLTSFHNIGSIKYGVSVTNYGPITGGSDGESDDSFRTRILQAKREKSWGTASVYNNFIRENVNGVHDIQFVNPHVLIKNKKYPRHYKENVTERDTYVTTTDVEQDKNSKDLKDENGKKLYVLKRDKRGDPITKSLETMISEGLLCTDCVRVLFVNGDKVTINNELHACGNQTLNDVEYVMSQQNNLVIGQLFHVQKAELVKLVFSMEIWCSAPIKEEVVYQHLVTFFDGGLIETKVGAIEYRGLNISESVTKNDLLNVIENIAGVEQVGSLHRMRFNDTLGDNVGWVDNGDNTYTYTDDDKYTFTKGTRTEDVIDPWGWANFSEITCEYGQVLTCGSKRDFDKASKETLDITVKLIDD